MLLRFNLSLVNNYFNLYLVQMSDEHYRWLVLEPLVHMKLWMEIDLLLLEKVCFGIVIAHLFIDNFFSTTFSEAHFVYFYLYFEVVFNNLSCEILRMSTATWFQKWLTRKQAPSLPIDRLILFFHTVNAPKDVC